MIVLCDREKQSGLVRRLTIFFPTLNILLLLALNLLRMYNLRNPPVVMSTYDKAGSSRRSTRYVSSSML